MQFRRAQLDIRRENGDAVSAQAEMQEGKCLFTWEDGNAEIVREETPSGSCLHFFMELEQNPFRGNNNLALESPVRIRLYVDDLRPDAVTSLYLFDDWWTRPAFAASLSGVPERTQLALIRSEGTVFGLLPAVGSVFKTVLMPGGEDYLVLELMAGIGGQSRVEEPVLHICEGEGAYDIINSLFREAAARNNVRPRAERRFPEIFEYLGWCSWDAFYRDVDEKGIREKAGEVTEKKIPIRWFLIDDGWQITRDERLQSFAPNPERFPAGFQSLTEDVRRLGMIRWFGVWHALAGYWGGIEPGSELAAAERENLEETSSGRLLPSWEPGRGYRFYRDWYEGLCQQGIDFVKVDVQGAVKNHYQDAVSLCEASRGLHEALEGAAEYFDGAVINCMGMAMEHALTRPVSPLSRNSDDFFPNREGSFREHLLENAYNSLWHGQLYYCDWDMFWTSHPDAVKHALLRAVSGGPVYVSDRPGETNPAVLAPIAYSDGRILRMDHPALVTEDCIFRDPFVSGVMKLTNTASCGGCKGGGAALFNLTQAAQDYELTPTDIPAIEHTGQYAVHSYFENQTLLCGKYDRITGHLSEGGYAWVQVVPRQGDLVCFGLAEKYAGFAAVTGQARFGSEYVVRLAESGPVRFAAVRTPKRICVGDDDWTGRILWEQRTDGCSAFVLPLAEMPHEVSIFVELD